MATVALQAGSPRHIFSRIVETKYIERSLLLMDVGVDVDLHALANLDLPPVFVS